MFQIFFSSIALVRACPPSVMLGAKRNICPTAQQAVPFRIPFHFLQGTCSYGWKNPFLRLLELVPVALSTRSSHYQSVRKTDWALRHHSSVHYADTPTDTPSAVNRSVFLLFGIFLPAYNDIVFIVRQGVVAFQNLFHIVIHTAIDNCSIVVGITQFEK